jgi:hypothetical protein
MSPKSIFSRRYKKMKQAQTSNYGVEKGVNKLEKYFILLIVNKTEMER